MKNADALTKDEIKALGTSAVPDVVRQFVSRKQDSLHVRAAAYRKVAAAARAEREAIVEVVACENARRKVDALSLGDQPPARAEFERVNDLLAENERLRQELERRIAAAAEVVHGD